MIVSFSNMVSFEAPVSFSNMVPFAWLSVRLDVPFGIVPFS